MHVFEVVIRVLGGLLSGHFLLEHSEVGRGLACAEFLGMPDSAQALPVDVIRPGAWHTKVFATTYSKYRCGVKLMGSRFLR